MYKDESELFALPGNVSYEKEKIMERGYAYVFYHDQVGKFGRILVLPHGSEIHISCEVPGDPKDPMTEERLVRFKPIAKMVCNKLGKKHN